MKKKKLVFCIVVALVFSILLLVFIRTFGVLHNNRSFKKAVTDIASSQITLNEITTFDWDVVYTFSPYLTEEYMEEIMGVKSIYISTPLNEGTENVYFVNDNKVVCFFQGIRDELGYAIDFWGDHDYYEEIWFEDEVLFSVEHQSNTVILTRD